MAPVSHIWRRLCRETAIWEKVELIAVFSLKLRTVGIAGVVGLIAALMTVSRCTQEPEGPSLVLAGPADYVGAVVTVDGRRVGKLEKQGIAARVFYRLVPRPGFFPREVVSLAIDVSNLPEGIHVVRVVYAGRELTKRSFMAPLTESMVVSVAPAGEGAAHELGEAPPLARTPSARQGYGGGIQ